MDLAHTPFSPETHMEQPSTTPDETLPQPPPTTPLVTPPVVTSPVDSSRKQLLVAVVGLSLIAVAIAVVCLMTSNKVVAVEQKLVDAQTQSTSDVKHAIDT